MSSLQPGTYRAKALTFQFGEAKTGAEQIGIEFTLLDEVDPAVDGQRITGYFYFTDKTTDNTLKALRLCGWKGDDLAELPGFGSSEVDLVLKSETWNGKTSTKVAYVNAPGGGGIAMGSKMDAAKKQSFAERMRASVVESRKFEVGAAQKDRFLA